MTQLLPEFTDLLLSQGIDQVAAVVNRKNIAARRVLEKARFSRYGRFDMEQNIYQVSH